MVKAERVTVGGMETNCYIVWKEKRSYAVVIDPGAESGAISRVLDKFRLSPEAVLLTHGHGDHIGACNELGLDVYVHKADSEFLSDPELNLSAFVSLPVTVKQPVHPFGEEDELRFEKSGLVFRVIHTPGHTPGGCCFLIDKFLFAGDTLFKESIGRTDFPASSFDKLINSIKEKIFLLPDETIVYPGHGESTTVGREKESNPFLS